MKSEADKVKEITSLHTDLKAIRQPYEGLIDKCIEFAMPNRRKIAATKQGGEQSGQTMYDSTASQALDLLGNGLHGNLFGPGWFKSTLPNTIEFPRYSVLRQYNGKRLDDIPEISEWLAHEQEVMVAAFARSNFYKQTPGIFKDGAGIGTSPIFVDKALDSDRIIFTAPHFREVWIGRNEQGDTDTVIREYEIQLKDAKDRFGESKMKEVMTGFEKRMENNPHEKITVLWAVYPRKEYDRNKITSDNMPIASCWVYNNKMLKESGFNRFQWVVWDWMRNNDEAYARGAAAMAINDIVLAQAQGKTNLLAGAKQADPPYAMMESLRGRNYLGPGGRTYYKNGETAPSVIDSNLRGLPVAMEFLERTERIINKWFYTDIFLMMNQAAAANKNITATQIYEMSGEKAIVTAPITEGIEYGFLNPITDIVFDFEYDAGPDGLPRGRIPAPPQILLDILTTTSIKIEVDYQGPLSLARKMFYKTQGIRTGIQNLTMVAQLKPDVIDVANLDKVGRLAVKDSFPPDCINDEKDVETVRQQRAQARQQAMMGQQLLEAAKAVPGLGKAVESGSPMEALTGLGG